MAKEFSGNRKGLAEIALDEPGFADDLAGNAAREVVRQDRELSRVASLNPAQEKMNAPTQRDPRDETGGFEHPQVMLQGAPPHPRLALERR